MRKIKTISCLFALLLLTGCGDGRPKYPGNATITMDNYMSYFEVNIQSWSKVAGTRTNRLTGTVTNIYRRVASCQVYAYYPDFADYDVTFTYNDYNYDWNNGNIRYTEHSGSREFKCNTAVTLKDGKYECFSFLTDKSVIITNVSGKVAKRA